MRQMPTAETPPFWSRREALAHYLRITGRDAGEFRFFRALSVFRSAIVFLQLFDRWRRDPAGNQRAAAFDRLGREMLDFAFDIASGRAD
jgi:aminoglycoside phosphotransferase (APT) family kinase protein